MGGSQVLYDALGSRLVQGGRLWSRKPFLLALVGVVLSLMAYVYVAIDVYADSVDIHGISPGRIHSGEFASCEVRNEAPLTFPFISPSYTVRMVVQAESGNNAFGCFEDASGGRWNFTDRYVDLGAIGTGESRSVGFFLYPDGGGAYIRLELYLSFLGINWKVGLFSTYLMYRGNDTYVFMFPV